MFEDKQKKPSLLLHVKLFFPFFNHNPTFFNIAYNFFYYSIIKKRFKLCI